MNKLFIGVLVAAMLGLVVFLFWTDIQGVFGTNKIAAFEEHTDQGKEGKKKNQKKEKADQETSAQVQITSRWELPKELVEISAIAFTNDEEVACIQDELGSIFIYNLASRQITRTVPFAGHGDYEGIAAVGSTIYVMKSQGTLYEVANYTSAQPTVTQYQTGLTAKQDVEGLTYDHRNNRLLLAIKGDEPGNPDYKGIYAFDLATKKMNGAPVYKIPLNDPVLDEGGKNHESDRIRPSDLVVHPSTGDIYVLEGTKPKLLILDASGKPKQIYKLKNSDFPQPEGINFNKKGELFISNEGRQHKGTILKVELSS